MLAVFMLNVWILIYTVVFENQTLISTGLMPTVCCIQEQILEEK